MHGKEKLLDLTIKFRTKIRKNKKNSSVYQKFWGKSQNFRVKNIQKKIIQNLQWSKFIQQIFLDFQKS